MLLLFGEGGGGETFKPKIPAVCAADGDLMVTDTENLVWVPESIKD